MTDQERLTALGLHPGEWRGAPGVFPAPKPSDDLRSRYRGCLLGGAIGDALGRPVEGWSRSSTALVARVLTTESRSDREDRK